MSETMAMGVCENLFLFCHGSEVQVEIAMFAV